ncbi:hypothetical protein KV110_29410 [Nocardia iowensis]|uniref:Uncharacterized protein n=1 Tax=Nocardia iowensis TaxID=204891 RepID=A0ABX8RMQ7_NOCIO|nr:hypothetical protein KV110_29410 [Nocardia iowensis]
MPIVSVDEVGVLAHAFNTMADGRTAGARTNPRRVRHLPGSRCRRTCAA